MVVLANTFMATSAACIAGVPELVFGRMVRSGNLRWLRKPARNDGLVADYANVGLQARAVMPEYQPVRVLKGSYLGAEEGHDNYWSIVRTMWHRAVAERGDWVRSPG